MGLYEIYWRVHCVSNIVTLLTFVITLRPHHHHHHHHNSCIVDPCLSISCPFGEHCVALDDVNATCESSCQHSNCTGVPDVDPCEVSDPCLHGGRCYKGPHGDSTCWCPFNFRGQFCESPLDMCAQYKCVLCQDNLHSS